VQTSCRREGGRAGWGDERRAPHKRRPFIITKQRHLQSQVDEIEALSSPNFGEEVRQKASRLRRNEAEAFKDERASRQPMNWGRRVKRVL
jgi:hypothetical protein